MIQAIETEYKGYLFRSRLEARWAVFFDTLGIKWEYEKEGYVLPDGTKYLPDFWLPEQDCFIEVKGIAPAYNSEESNKATQLAIASKRTVYVTYGQIEFPWEGYSDSMEAHFGDHGWDNQYWFCECTDCGLIGIQFNGRSDRLPCKKHSYIKHENATCSVSSHGDKGYAFDTDRLVNAYYAARQARFEHGAHGSPYPYMTTRYNHGY